MKMMPTQFPIKCNKFYAMLTEKKKNMTAFSKFLDFHKMADWRRKEKRTLHHGPCQSHFIPTQSQRFRL
jgi:hypothetical protein